MNFYDKDLDQIIVSLNSDKNLGLGKNEQIKNVQKFGRNVLTMQKKLSFFNRLINAIKEPMLVILLFGFIITFGSALGKFFKTGENDFVECFGILFAVIVSVSITSVMEGTSERAFEVLNNMYRNVAVRVIRDGKIRIISEQDLIVGDIVLIESGDKIRTDAIKLSNESEEEYKKALTDDFEKISQILLEELDKKTEIVAYPYGRHSELSNQIFKELGIKMTLATSVDINKIDKGNKECLYNLHRYTIHENN